MIYAVDEKKLRKIAFKYVLMGVVIGILPLFASPLVGLSKGFLIPTIFALLFSIPGLFALRYMLGFVVKNSKVEFDESGISCRLQPEIRKSILFADIVSITTHTNKAGIYSADLIGKTETISIPARFNCTEIINALVAKYPHIAIHAKRDLNNLETSYLPVVKMLALMSVVVVGYAMLVKKHHLPPEAGGRIGQILLWLSILAGKFIH